MANRRRGNIHFVDTAETLSTVKNQRVSAILVTATSANAIVVIQDPSDSADVLELRVPTSGLTETFNFSQNLLVFPNGIKVSTLTNAKIAIVYNGE
jgi:hypothetical protein